MNRELDSQFIKDRSLWGCYASATGSAAFSDSTLFLAAMAERFELTADALGLLAMIETIGIVVASGSAYYWFGRFDPQRLIQISLIAMVLGYLLAAFAASLPVLFLVRLFSGVVGHGLAFVIGITWLCQSREPDRAIAISVVSQLFVGASLVTILPVVFESLGLNLAIAFIVIFCFVLAPLALKAQGPSP